MGNNSWVGIPVIQFTFLDSRLSVHASPIITFSNVLADHLSYFSQKWHNIFAEDKFSLTAPLRRWVAEDCEVPADSEKQPTPGLSCQCCRCCSTLFLLFVCPTVANDTLPLTSLSMRCCCTLAPVCSEFFWWFEWLLSLYFTRISLVCPAVICLPTIICDCTVYKVHFPKCSI